MATKRKEPTEGTRRSERTKAAPAAEAPKPAAAAAAPKKAPASKGKSTTTAPPASKEEEENGKASAVAAEKEEEEKEVDDDQEAEEVEEPAKKAKTSSTVLSVGDVVPDVVLKNENEEEVSFASIYEKSGVVVFSYPKANTSGCTTQACGFRDKFSEISDLGYQVYGLSADPPKSQLSWKNKHSFGYSLLSDPSKELLKQLGATESKKRNHWIIEKGGKVLEAKIGVKPADDPSNVVEFLKSL